MLKANFHKWLLANFEQHWGKVKFNKLVALGKS